MKLKTNNKGFTIVELLIVIVVIGILAAIAVVAYNGVTTRANDTKRESNARNIANALAVYNSENEAWPKDATEAKTFLSNTNNVAKVDSGVINSIGTNPTADNKDTYGIETCSGNGVKVVYWKATKRPAAGTETIVAGNC